MKSYLLAFMNKKQNNWAILLPINRCAYDNAKNKNINTILFELKMNLKFKILYEKYNNLQ